MENVIPLRNDAPQTTAVPADQERRLVERFGFSERQLRDAVRPLFLLMHDHGVKSLAIAVDGSKAVISVDGKAL